MNRCDSCGKFGETEDVVITIKKHHECDINGAFGTVTPANNVRVPLNLPIVHSVPTTITGDMELIKSVNHELNG